MYIKYTDIKGVKGLYVVYLNTGLVCYLSFTSPRKDVDSDIDYGVRTAPSGRLIVFYESFCIFFYLGLWSNDHIGLLLDRTQPHRALKRSPRGRLNPELIPEKIKCGDDPR